ncbi:hypothetical protein SERLADRAFT_457878 [Serpula lacrymans var. lacrymans S7.9]|uniref:Uncharacterized protein n=1 Tax=Serpula lacrymans var. lacrymans (strain S7.9) TaxID=578457 RepID=F8NHZ5_SERL9|nr:uncharacterized protein SERLADRAFT_457878 [Serpula lacrymans var. lacrymans S7.9]EGO29717.1 hypothetical protein SERLADRAFT_457878 [Serpula lacrymans var. lacrymans S7.9]
MKDVVRSLPWSLESFAEAEPIRVYALATKHGQREIAQKAAFNTLRQPFGEWEFVPELKYITGTDLQKLFCYHVACGKLASSTIESCRQNANILAGSTFSWYTCRSGSSDCKSSGLWWQKVIDELAVALKQKPRGGVLEEGHDLITRTSLAVNDCCICRLKAPADMERFKHEIVTKIDQVISQYRLPPTIYRASSPLLARAIYKPCRLRWSTDS